MSLSKKQKDFLKTIENPKYKKYQKQQFKLQNKFYKFGLVEEIIFIDGIFKTDNPELIAFLNECPMVEKIEENSLTKESKSFDEVMDKLPERFRHPKFTGTIVWDENILTKESLRDLTEPKNEIPKRSFPSHVGTMNKSGIVSKEKLNFIPTGNFLIDSLNLANQSSELISRIYKEKEKRENLSKTPDVKPLDFDLPNKENPIQNIECLSINDIIDSGVLIVESPLCQKLKKHLIGLVEKKTNPLGLK